MSKKLAAKASLIQAPPAPVPAASPAPERVEPGDARPKTAPGSMALFMASQSAAIKEADELRERLKAFDGAQPVRSLDPQTVRPSRWANRHEHSYSDAAFLELKADIAAAGTNVQPISVRPLRDEVLNGSTPANAAYELVFGHRRHRACLELGLPVQALITELSDQALFEAMERENRARKNLSPWEQGCMYRRALEQGLYPSLRRLAESVGVDVSLVSKSVSLARLPDAVVAAFASPLDIQFRWAQPLAEALQKDPEGVLARAASIRKTGQGGSAVQVFAALTALAATGVLNGSTPGPRVVEGSGGRRAVMKRDSRGRLSVEFTAGAVTPEAESALVAYIEKMLGKAK